ncbi:MAG: FAD-dependent monooxygenase [Rhodospirillum sp.]|nr:FAD-dependent monooxygenase [Rhodospirillum sp.]
MNGDRMIADLVILGGGPAGAIAARMAATRGARVLLVDPDRTPERLEGLSERLLGWLRGQGLDSRLPEGSPFVPRKALWAGRESAHNGEYLVERAALDRSLRAAAKDAGAKIVTASGQVDRLGPDLEVEITLSDGRHVLAPRVIDARGRKAHVGRPVTRGPATLAIGGWFEDRLDAEPEARILPLPEGWLWIARPGGGRLWVQATLDAREGDGASPAARLREALDGASRIGALPGTPPSDWVDKVPLGAPLVRDCAPVLPTGSIDLRLIPAGDAAAGMDPLSGNGMFWAVSGALAAFAALETLAARPGPDSETLARRYLEERIRETYRRQARLGRDFLLQETRYAAHPFWARRRSFPDDRPLHDPGHDQNTPVAGSVAVERTIVVETGLLAERDVLITDREPSGVAWLAGIPAVEAYHMLRDGAGEEALAGRWGAEAARAAMAWFRARSLFPLPR